MLGWGDAVGADVGLSVAAAGVADGAAVLHAATSNDAIKPAAPTLILAMALPSLIEPRRSASASHALRGTATGDRLTPSTVRGKELAAIGRRCRRDVPGASSVFIPGPWQARPAARQREHSGNVLDRPRARPSRRPISRARLPPMATLPARAPLSERALSERVRTVPPSGIRRFFDILASMDDVISL